MCREARRGTLGVVGRYAWVPRRDAQAYRYRCRPVSTFRDLRAPHHTADLPHPPPCDHPRPHTCREIPARARPRLLRNVPTSVWSPDSHEDGTGGLYLQQLGRNAGVLLAKNIYDRVLIRPPDTVDGADRADTHRGVGGEHGVHIG